MKQLLLSVLEQYGYPVKLQGTMPDDEAYPETFITFFTLSSDDVSHYDNDTDGWEWNYQICVYSEDPNIVQTLPMEIMKDLKAAGFIPQGKGQDIVSDEPTHTGWLQFYLYKEKNRKGA